MLQADPAQSGLTPEDGPRRRAYAAAAAPARSAPPCSAAQAHPAACQDRISQPTSAQGGWVITIGATRSANSRAMMARRTAGRLGDSGGAGIWRGIFPRPRRALPGEAEVLQVGKGDAGHQRVSVQAGPGPPLEVAETEFLFELLMPLLANPTCFDGCGQGTQRGPRRQ